MSAWNGQGRRQLRIAAAVTLLGLAGCADNAASPQMASPSLAPVKIEPQGGVEPAQARRLSELIAGETRRRNIDLHDEKLTGVVDASRLGDGLYLVVVIDVSDGKGARLHRIVDESMRSERTLADADLARIAVNAVDKLSLWRMAALETAVAGDTTGSIAPANGIASSAGFDIAPLGPDERVATGSIAAILAVKPVFDIAIGPAPGDGAEALKSALTSELSKAALAGDTSRYNVRGNVEISSRDDGDINVAIRWQVTSADGKPIGTVTQTRTAAPSRIASYWGGLAKAAAGPAVDGILAMLNPIPRHPGNAS